MRFWRKSLLSGKVVVAILVLGLAIYFIGEPYFASAPLRHSLLDALDHAETVKVVEHSNPQSYRERTLDG